MNHIKGTLNSISIMFLLILVGFVASAQVGVGTDNPDPRAILHLQSSDKGHIIPTLNSSEIDAMTLSPTPPNGTMVFNTDSNEVYVFYSTKWHSLTPLEKEHNQAAPNKGRIRATKNSISVKSLDATTVNAFDGNGITPIGGIIMWSGTNVPAGWALCNSQTVNGHPTPNLTGRFIVGVNPSDARFNSTGYYSDHAKYKAGGGIATPVYSAGDFGGQDSVTLDVNTIPPHQHNGYTNTDGDHGHSGNMAFTADNDDWDHSHAAISNEPLGHHGHGAANLRAGGAAHRHFFTTNSGGGWGKAHNNLPPHYTLAFIMRVK